MKYAFLISLFALLGLWSLIKSPFYTSHDGFTHTARIMAYYESVKDGQFPPRWATKFSGNLGSPIFVYSYPLPYFLGAVLHLGGIHFQDAYRLVIGGGYILSGLAAFWWLSKRFGKQAGLVGAVFYIFAPYRFLNLYVRGAYAESFAYMFVPLVFLAIDQGWWSFLALATAGLLLSHNVVAAMILPIAVALAILRRKMFALLGLAGGFLMSSFIYLPDLLERKYIQFDQGISYWREHFVTWWQLVRSHWGYGFDFPGTVNDDMSFQLGLTQILVVGLLICLVIWLIMKRKFKWQSVVNIEGLFFLAVLLGAVFMMVDEPLIVPLWKELPLIKTIIDFPWRFLGVTVVVFSFLAAYLVYLAKNSKLLVIGLLVMVVIANRNHIRVNEVLSFSDKAFEGYHGTSTAGSNEYNTVWHKSQGFPGDLKTSGTVNKATGMEFTINEATSGLRINRFYFPETNIYYNGRKLVFNQDYEIISQRQDKDFDDTGLIRLNSSQPGRYYLKFVETPLRKTADWISLLALGLISILGVREIVQRKK